MRSLIHLLDGESMNTDMDKVAQDKILEILTSGRSEARHVKVLKLLNDEMEGERDKDDRDTDRGSSSIIRHCNGSSVLGRRIV